MNFSLSKIVFLFILTRFSLGYGQHFGTPETINNANGLADTYVLNTVKAPSGYLYLATKKGVLKYDGYRFMEVTNAKAIWSQLEIKDSLIYYHDADGLFQLDSNTDLSTCLIPNNFNDSDPNNDHFNNIFVDSKGNIWGTDFNYVKYFSPKQKKQKSYLINADTKTLDHYSIIEPLQNEIWAASKSGLWVCNKTSNKLQLHQNEKINKLSYTSAFVTNKNEVFLATETGEIFEINAKTNLLQTYSKLPKQESAQGFFSLKNGVFCYSSKHIYAIKNNLYSEIYNSEEKIINNVNYDPETKILWIATDKGLVKFPPINSGIEILNFPKQDSLENTVISILERADKSIWTLTDSGKIWSFWDGKWSLQFQNNNSKNYVLNEVGNELLLSTNAGILIWKDKNFEKTSFKNSQTNAKIIKVLKVSENEIWVVFSQEKIQRFSWPDFKPLPDQFTNDGEFWKDNQWNDIIVDKNDQIWLAGWMPKGYGITKYNPVKHYFLDISEEKINEDNSVFVGDYYNRISLGNTTNLIFSAYGGLNIVDENGKVIEKIDVHKYPINDPHIEGISEDNSGNLFFATGEGLYIYRKDLDKVSRISKLDGLPTNNILNAYTKLSNGKIALGLQDGIALINSEKILISQLQNKLVLSQIKINGVLQNSIKTDIELSKDQTDLTLYFSNLSFLDPTKVKYKYRFKGDKDWQKLGNTPELSLNHISPGNYRIFIKTEDNLYNLQEKMLQISVVAHPPFFRSNVFYIFLGVLIIGIVILVQRYLLKRKQKEANYVQKIKETEMQMLRAQMNPHFMFNTLNSINSYIIQNKTEDASAYLTTFSKLMRNILQNSKEQFITLENELQTLRLYLQLESARLEHSFCYKINVDENITENDILVPPLIIQPFVENAIWHGLRTKSKNGNLGVSVYVNGANKLQIFIEDNGVGRKKSGELKTNQVSHKSYGMEITLDRLKMLDSDNTIEIEDLYDAENNALGTKVILTLKISEND